MASKTCDEIWKIVRVKVSAQNVRDPMAAHTGFDEVHQGVRTTMQQNIVIRAHQIASSGSARMHTRTGPKNGKLYGSLVDTPTCEQRKIGLTHQAGQECSEPQSSRNWQLVPETGSRWNARPI